MSSPQPVVSGLYVGDKRLAASKDVLQRLGVTNVVNVTVDVRHYFLDDAAFSYHRCPSNDTDSADILPLLDAATAFIDAALTTGHGVLVHCQQGVSRSAAVVLAFLIRYRQLSLSSAYVLLRTARPEAKPNANFLRQLMQWEQQQLSVHGESEDSPHRAKRQRLQGAVGASSPSPSSPSPEPKRYGPSPPPPTR